MHRARSGRQRGNPVVRVRVCEQDVVLIAVGEARQSAGEAQDDGLDATGYAAAQPAVDDDAKRLGARRPHAHAATFARDAAQRFRNGTIARCCASITRPWSVSTVSPLSTGTRSWCSTGPASYSAVAAWNVNPVTRSPARRTASCTCRPYMPRPPNLGSSDG